MTAFLGRMAASLLLLAVSLAGGPAAAQETAPLRVELNKLEEAGADCRATVVTENAGSDRLESLKLDLVVFGGDGVVAKRLAAEFGPLPGRKTVVKTFPIGGLSCTAIDRVLVNDVVACASPAGPVAGCVERIEPSSRAAARFVK
ncbi:Tat pathway signal protein [Mongoliimonas terrestris]|uniref:Tat pathway signal protein n=1 Tax=Mongoliimonas terrestris TaxID=1709001 RepID=UPI000A5163A3|nr:Tat pathway signal protein [Mongoliimonas terrestris]